MEITSHHITSQSTPISAFLVDVQNSFEGSTDVQKSGVREGDGMLGAMPWVRSDGKPTHGVASVSLHEDSG